MQADETRKVEAVTSSPGTPKVDDRGDPIVDENAQNEKPKETKSPKSDTDERR